MPKNETLQILIPERLTNASIVYTFNVGLSESLVPQLINYSTTDPFIRRYTSDTSRFRDEQAYLTWRKKDRTIYSLTNEDGTELVGIVWFGREVIPYLQFELLEQIKPEDYGITTAKRLYGEARGKGIAKGMMRMAYTEYLKTHLQDKHTGIWSMTSTDNERNIRVNESFGIRRVSKPNSNGKILMVVSYEDLVATLKPK